jgi:glycosyltransferase involved in cell wall biosynthesis
VSVSVLHIITEPTGGGAERLIRELNQLLPRYGVQSSILFLKNPNKVQLYTGEDCLFLKNQRSPLAVFKIKRYLTRCVPSNTILHGHLVDALFLLAAPFVADGFIKVYTEHSTYNRRRRVPYFYLIEKYFYLKFVKIVCISDAVKKNLNEWLKFSNAGGRLCTIYNGSRLFSRGFSTKTQGEKLRFISVGSLKYVKGFDTAIQAFSKMNNFSFVYKIIGEGPERKYLQKLIIKYRLENEIQLLGYVDDGIENYYWDSDVLIIPSRWEGFGLVAVEGMSAGLPILASNVDGLNEIVKGVKSTILFDPDSPDDLCRAIEEISMQSHRFSEYFKESEGASKKYSMEEMAKSYSKIYFDL